MESDEGKSGVVKAAGVGELLERAHKTFEQGIEDARKAALVIVEKMRNLHDSPDEMEITFGVKASGELKILTVAKSGLEASYNVKLMWKK